MMSKQPMHMVAFRAFLALCLVASILLYFRGYLIPSLISLGIGGFLAAVSKEGAKEAVIQVGSLAFLVILVVIFGKKNIWLDWLLFALFCAWLITGVVRWRKRKFGSEKSKSSAE